jgi:hypothetical protein
MNLPSLTSISDWGFLDCAAISNVNLPSLTSVGEGGFAGCLSLKNLNVPNLNEVGKSIFSESQRVSAVLAPLLKPIDFICDDEDCQKCAICLKKMETVLQNEAVTVMRM